MDNNSRDFPGLFSPLPSFSLLYFLCLLPLSLFVRQHSLVSSFSLRLLSSLYLAPSVSLRVFSAVPSLRSLPFLRPAVRCLCRFSLLVLSLLSGICLLSACSLFAATFPFSFTVATLINSAAFCLRQRRPFAISSPAKGRILNNSKRS